MTHERLRDYTTDELAQLKHKAKPAYELRTCLWCDKDKLMRHGQHFCSPACRVAFSRAEVRLAHEKLVQEKQAWLIEREGYIQEISALKKQLRENHDNTTST